MVIITGIAVTDGVGGHPLALKFTLEPDFVGIMVSSQCNRFESWISNTWYLVQKLDME